MDVEITPRAQEMAWKYGIEPEEITEVIEGEEEVARGVRRMDLADGETQIEACQTLECWEDGYCLYVGEPPASNARNGEKRYVVVAVTESTSSKLRVRSAHVVPQSMAAGEGPKRGTETLRTLANDSRFGLGVVIGGVPFPFDHEKTIQLNEPAEDVTPDNEAPADEVVVENLVDIRDDEARVCLAFAVHAGAVREHLGL